MEIEKYRDYWTGAILNRPLNKKDMPLFLHCSGGAEYVPTKFLNSVVVKLLFAHGVVHIKTINKVKRLTDEEKETIRTRNNRSYWYDTQDILHGNHW